jgi:phosphohistidine phosphatase
VSNVLLVSHQPLVGNLLGYLQHGASAAGRHCRPGSLAELDSAGGLMSLVSVKNP